MQYVGGLKGTWKLYNFGLDPKYGPSSEYFRIHISDYALEYFEPDQEHLREQNGELKEDKQYVSVSDLEHQRGDRRRYSLPLTCASISHSDFRQHET